MTTSIQLCSTRKLQIVIMLFVSTILLSSFALVTSLNVKSIPSLSSSSSFSSLNGRVVIRRSSRSTTLHASIDDKISAKKFYGFRSVAGQGVPTGAQTDPLSVPMPSSFSIPQETVQTDPLSVPMPSSFSIPQETVSTFTASITPTLTIPSSPTSSMSPGFKDIPPISSTASPSLDSTLTFSNQPKSEATFTLLDRMKRMNTKFKLVQEQKTTTWDSPRFVRIYFLCYLCLNHSIVKFVFMRFINPFLSNFTCKRKTVKHEYFRLRSTPFSIEHDRENTHSSIVKCSVLCVRCRT
jgi:hypothetical protein